jgi:hypothetical protein
MHEFRAGKRYFGKPDPEYRSMGMDPVENERTVRLSEVLRRTGPKLIYTYDLGDSWEHAIVLRRRRLAEMYGPPSECKGKVWNEGKSASMYPAFRWRVFSWP